MPDTRFHDFRGPLVAAATVGWMQAHSRRRPAVDPPDEAWREMVIAIARPVRVTISASRRQAVSANACLIQHRHERVGHGATVPPGAAASQHEAVTAPIETEVERRVVLFPDVLLHAPDDPVVGGPLRR